MTILILLVYSGSVIHGVVFTAVDRYFEIVFFFFSFPPQFGYRLRQRGYVFTLVRLFAGWSDLQRDYTKATEEIPTKH